MTRTGTGSRHRPQSGLAHGCCPRRRASGGSARDAPGRAARTAPEVTPRNTNSSYKVVLFLYYGVVVHPLVSKRSCAPGPGASMSRGPTGRRSRSAQREACDDHRYNDRPAGGWYGSTAGKNKPPMVRASSRDALVYTVLDLEQQSTRIMSQVEETREPAFITRDGRFIAVITPLAPGQVESRVLRRDGTRAQRTGRAVTTQQHTPHGFLARQRPGARCTPDAKPGPSSRPW